MHQKFEVLANWQTTWQRQKGRLSPFDRTSRLFQTLKTLWEGVASPRPPLPPLLHPTVKLSSDANFIDMFVFPLSFSHPPPAFLFPFMPCTIYLFACYF